ncbi:hypothetical protein LWE61_13085 [Sphingobium sufflavum]|uniref:hypothetical protein n=1 Tax=Sphingobium sufflavum TaxID=1129547 RepID=UPI001F1AD41F|nr:hypothetical protein [Sphingobium sufflavum]MCE7797485.1 hypothetical protein [Sphingobium sufflavum]
MESFSGSENAINQKAGAFSKRMQPSAGSENAINQKAVATEPMQSGRTLLGSIFELAVDDHHPGKCPTKKQERFHVMGKGPAGVFLPDLFPVQPHFAPELA